MRYHPAYPTHKARIAPIRHAKCGLGGAAAWTAVPAWGTCRSFRRGESSGWAQRACGPCEEGPFIAEVWFALVRHTTGFILGQHGCKSPFPTVDPSLVFRDGGCRRDAPRSWRAASLCAARPSSRRLVPGSEVCSLRLAPQTGRHSSMRENRSGRERGGVEMGYRGGD